MAALRLGYLERTLQAAGAAARRPLLCARVSGQSGLLQSISPTVRTPGLLGLAAAAALLPPAGAAMVLAFLLANAACSRVSPRLLWAAGSGAAVALAAVLALPALVLVPGAPALVVWAHPPLAITRPGLVTVGGLVLRAAGASAAGVTLALTTPWHQVCRALRRLGLPAVMGAVAEVAYYQAVVLAGHLERMARGRRSREYRPAGGREWAASRAGALYRAAQACGERSFLGMQSRGYRAGAAPVGEPTRARDWLWLAGAAGVVVLAWAVG